MVNRKKTVHTTIVITPAKIVLLHRKVAIRHTKRLASKFIAEVPRCTWPHLAVTYITSSETRLT